MDESAEIATNEPGNRHSSCGNQTFGAIMHCDSFLAVAKVTKGSDGINAILLRTMPREGGMEQQQRAE
jgi:hypothetical protein